MIAPSHYYVLLCNIFKRLCVCHLNNWMIFLSLSFFFFTWHILSNCALLLAYVTCILTVSIFIIMHCYCFTNVHCIVWHSIVLVHKVSFVIYFMLVRFLILTCLIFNCDLTDFGFVKQVHVYVIFYILLTVYHYVSQ
jgi:hypothetical protein